MGQRGIYQGFSSVLRMEKSFSITNREKVVAVIVPPHDIAQISADDAYGRLIELRTKFPIGTVREVMDWKNEGRK